MPRQSKGDKFWSDPSQVIFFRDKPGCSHVRDFLSKVKSPSSKKVLDLGCGGGRNTEMLVKMGFDAHGVDSSTAMVQATRERLANFFSSREAATRIIQGSMLNLPYPADSFDLIVSTGVYHQARSERDYTQAISESSRVLKKGGWIVLNIFTNEAWDKTYTKVDRKKYTVITKDGLYMTLLPKKRLLEMMADHGFKLSGRIKEEIKEINKGPRCVLRAVFRKVVQR